MSQALYRKYRSRSLAEVVGQEHITDTLARALKAGRIGHAYLFTGPRGTGKTSVARILAHQINKLPYSDTQNLDIVEIDAASNRRIDDIRDLREKVHIAPLKAPYKVYIIDEVHMLTGESFNALLKTLEEPPAHVVFILATTEAHKLPATIISRTQRFAFRLAAPQKVIAHLRSIADKENIVISDDALALIAEHGEGSFRDSVSLLDQLRHVADTIGADDVIAMLGLAPQSTLQTLIEAIITGDRPAAVKALSDLEARGSATSTVATQLCKALAAKAPEKPELYHLIDNLLDVPRAYNPGLKLLTTVLTFVANQTPPAKTEVKHVAEMITAKPVVEISKSVAAPKAGPKPAPIHPPTPATPQTPTGELTAQQWSVILEDVKRESPPLHGALKQAQPAYDSARNTLTVTFKYSLHSKKLDDPKQKTVLAKILQARLGHAPAISAAVNKDVTPPPVASDPAVASVAEIMGGGEVVHAETI